MTSRDLVFPAFFGDALALGAHWIYDEAEIAAEFPQGILNYEKPRSDYHPGKKSGDLTHYGDQTLLLLESIANHGGFDRDAWRSDWLAFWHAKPETYLDGATRQTLAYTAAGLDQPSDSHDLGGASRAVALLALPSSDDDLAAMARAQTLVTHGDPRVAAAAEFLVRSVRRVMTGATFAEAFQQSAVPHLPDIAPATHMAKEQPEKLADLGLSCDVAKALPLMVALALVHETEPSTCLRENARLGGDSAARGLGLGALLGARHGFSAFPESWASSLFAGSRIDSALERIAAATT